ncbi:AbrB/MazE/SpoVT family DNA-binding domain-containing protein [Geoglobus ahangari]
MGGKILGLSNVTKKFQITLVKEVREKLGIRDGDKVLFIEGEREGEVIIRKA